MRLRNLHTGDRNASGARTVVIGPGSSQKAVFAGNSQQVLFHCKGVGRIKDLHALQAGFGPSREVPMLRHNTRVRNNRHTACALDVLYSLNGGYPGRRHIAGLSGH